MLGALLAGGAASRLGGSKATLDVAGRPLASYAAEALLAVCDPVVFVCKAATELPGLPDVDRWDEPDEPRHPLTGILHALERAQAPVLVCAADMPFVTADACRTLIAATAVRGGRPAAVAVAAGILQPVFGVFAPSALELLRNAGEDLALTVAVESLDPVRVALPPPLVRSVNSPEDLEAAAVELGSPA